MTIRIADIFNGTYTISSALTGEHKTFRLKTFHPGSRWMPGKRVLQALDGPDNRSDYRNLGVLEGDEITLFKKADTERGQELAKMFILALNGDDRWIVRAAATCIRCNKKLTHPISIDSGIGPICAGREVNDGFLNLDGGKLVAIRTIATMMEKCDMTLDQIKEMVR